MKEYEQWKIFHCANVDLKDNCRGCIFKDNCKEFTAMAINEFMGRKDKKEGSNNE